MIDSLPEILLWAMPAAFWAMALGRPLTRTLRFILFAVLLTVLWMLAGSPGAPLRVALVFIGVFGLVSPQVLRLASVTAAEIELDAEIRELAKGSEGHDARAIRLRRVRAGVRRDPLRLAAATVRYRAGERRQAQGSSPEMLTPVSAYDVAAGDLERAARVQRVVGPRARPSAWDEEVVLRAFHEQAESLIPTDALVARPIVELGAWTQEVTDLLGDLERLPFADPVASQARDQLRDAIRAKLLVAEGDRSESALGEQARTAAQMADAWQRLRDHVGAPDSRPTPSQSA